MRSENLCEAFIFGALAPPTARRFQGSVLKSHYFLKRVFAHSIHPNINSAIVPHLPLLPTPTATLLPRMQCCSSSTNDKKAKTPPAVPAANGSAGKKQTKYGRRSQVAAAERASVATVLSEPILNADLGGRSTVHSHDFTPAFRGMLQRGEVQQHLLAAVALLGSCTKHPRTATAPL